MPTPIESPDASDYMKLFARYRDDAGDAARDFGKVYLEPEDDRYRLLFEQICHLLVKISPFNLQMPQAFRHTAQRYLNSDPKTLAHMRTPQMQHFMLSDFYDYAHLCERMGQRVW
ncbi:MAG: hypothetical protein RL701_4479 [Pseudomonadota bacterium]